MKTDLEIAQKAKLKPIKAIAKSIGLKESELFLYGDYMAKVSLSSLARLKKRKSGKYIVVSAITPTPLGEGKTVTTIGLSMALNKIGEKSVLCIRQPSLGPVFGIKGGAAGGGYSQVVPMEDFNLHLTGDTHAVGLANNLCAAFLDNSVFKKNRLKIDKDSIKWRRVMDVSDRFLRKVIIGMGGRFNGFPRKTGFDITAASEVMAILALASDIKNLRKRLGEIVLAMSKNGRPVTAGNIGVAGVMAAVLKDAVKPNLLQTIENTPCFVHAGPFANIAPGNSSIIADRIALKLSDYVVTESGFGADMGAEKLFDIKCRASGLKPDCVVLVATARALKMHSGKFKVEAGRPLDRALSRENIPALEKGCVNLEKHIENMRLFGIPVIVAINKFDRDTKKEIEVIRERAKKAGAAGVVLNTAWRRGSEGARELARAVKRVSAKKSHFRFLYPLNLPIKKKIETLARKIYGAKTVKYTRLAEKKIKSYTRLGYGKLPVCMAKTHLSLSCDPARKGRPEGFTMKIKDVRLSSGAGFLYPMCGKIRTMPGLPTHPAGENVDIAADGTVRGLF